MIPTGQRALTLGVMLGHIAPHVQIDRVAHIRQDTIERRTWNGQAGVTPASHIFDRMQPLGGDLYAAAPESLLVVPPPTSFSGARVVEIIFRPIGTVQAAANRLAA